MGIEEVEALRAASKLRDAQDLRDGAGCATAGSPSARFACVAWVGSPVAVLERMPRSIERILVPHDFSETADAALAMALDLAEKMRARVTILHAYEVPTYVFPESVVATADLVGQIRGAAEEALANLKERTQRPGVQVDTTLRQGVAWSEINQAAKELGSDLVVMGTHGRRGFSRALIGSVAEKVVRTAPCPVLTVHGPAQAP
jgi:nucleotide-binding universal stress UspA family protein